MLIGMYGGAGTIGKNGLLTIDAAVNQAVCAILPSKGFYPEYVLRFMQLQRPYWMIGADGTRKDPNISQERIRDSFIVCPPIQEQIDIAQNIKEFCKDIDENIFIIQNVINSIREYRTRLIADVVTGKLDVRGAVFDMPAEFDETDLPDVADDEFFEDEEPDDLGELDSDENGYD